MDEYGSFVDHLKLIPDMRMERGRRHKLVDILFIALCTILSGGEGFQDMLLFAKHREDRRIEERRCWAVEGEAGWLGLDKNWKNVRTIAMISRERTIRGKRSIETTYYITSLAANAEKIATVARSHWRVENSLHWVLDVTMNEDMNRIRKDHAPENLAVMRRIAISMVNQVKGKMSVRGYLKSAGWNTSILEQVLVGHRLLST